MARTVATIQTSMDAEQALQPTLASELTSPSTTALYRLWKYITSVVINLHEQLWDKKKVELEAIVEIAAPGSEAWLKQRVLEFQYDALTPQIFKVDPITFVGSYETLDKTKRIITRVAIKNHTTHSREAVIKIAVGEPPEAATDSQLKSILGYCYNSSVGIGFAGVKLTPFTAASDKFYFKAVISHNGQYAATIKTNVISAIKSFLANIPFDGYVKIISLVDIIQAVSGVTDIHIEHAAIRADATPFASKTYLIQNFTELFSKYETYAGYITEENTAGQDFASTLTFTVG